MSTEKKRFYQCTASFYDDGSGHAKVYLTEIDASRRDTQEPEMTFSFLEDLEDQLRERYEMEP